MSINRDIFKTAKQANAHINDRYDLTLQQLSELLNYTEPFNNSKVAEALIIAFEYGYEMGSRSERARIKRDKK